MTEYERVFMDECFLSVQLQNSERKKKKNSYLSCEMTKTVSCRDVCVLRMDLVVHSKKLNEKISF